MNIFRSILKYTILKKIILILLILTTKNFSQILDDFKIYSNGSIPAIAVDDSNNIHITYAVPYLDMRYIIFDSLLNMLSDTITISDTKGSAETSINIRKNNIAMVWREIRVNFKDYIQGTIFERDVTPIIDTLIYFNDDFISDYNRWSPQVCFLNDTLLLTVWYGFGPIDPLNTSIYGQFYSLSSKKHLGSNFIINDHDQYETISKRTLVRSFNKSSDFVVIWIDDYSGENKIYGQLFDSTGSTKDTAFLISDVKNMSDFFYLSLEVDNKDDFVVVWSAKIDTVWNIYWRWFNKQGQPLNEVIQLTEISDRVSEYSDVDCSISKEGKIIVVWESNIKQYSRIFAQRFTKDRIPIDRPFRISSYERPYYQLSARVILNNDKIYNFWGESGNGVWANIIDFNNPLDIEKKISFNKSHGFILYQNYPNPFNSITTVNFYLNNTDNIDFNIYDIKGRIIKTFIKGFNFPGKYSFNWNAKNNLGMDVSTGIYFGVLKSTDEIQVIKIVLLR